MGITLEDVMELANELKEALWYLSTCKSKELAAQKEAMNNLLDSLDELKAP